MEKHPLRLGAPAAIGERGGGARAAPDLHSLLVKSISLRKIATIGAAASLTAQIALSIVRG